MVYEKWEKNGNIAHGLNRGLYFEQQGRTCTEE